jgi:hypothetical protein
MVTADKVHGTASRLFYAVTQRCGESRRATSGLLAHRESKVCLDFGGCGCWAALSDL